MAGETGPGWKQWSVGPQDLLLNWSEVVSISSSPAGERLLVTGRNGPAAAGQQQDQIGRQLRLCVNPLWREGGWGG